MGVSSHYDYYQQQKGVIAILRETKAELHTMNGCYEALVPVEPTEENSPLADTHVSPAYLRKLRRLREAQARRMHPGLFEILDADEA